MNDIEKEESEWEKIKKDLISPIGVSIISVVIGLSFLAGWKFFSTDSSKNDHVIPLMSSCECSKKEIVKKVSKIKSQFQGDLIKRKYRSLKGYQHEIKIRRAYLKFVKDPKEKKKLEKIIRDLQFTCRFKAETADLNPVYCE